MDRFRSLQDAHGETLTHNYRPIQPLNDRVVLFNTGGDYDDKTDDNTLAGGGGKSTDDDANKEQIPNEYDESVTKQITTDVKDEYDIVGGSTTDSQEMPDDDLDVTPVKEPSGNNALMNDDDSVVSTEATAVKVTPTKKEVAKAQKGSGHIFAASHVLMVMTQVVTKHFWC